MCLNEQLHLIANDEVGKLVQGYLTGNPGAANCSPCKPHEVTVWLNLQRQVEGEVPKPGKKNRQHAETNVNVSRKVDKVGHCQSSPNTKRAIR